MEIGERHENRMKQKDRCEKVQASIGGSATTLGSTGTGTSSAGGESFGSSEVSESRIHGLREGRIELATFRGDLVAVKRMKAGIIELDNKCYINLIAVCFAMQTTGYSYYAAYFKRTYLQSEDFSISSGAHRR